MTSADCPDHLCVKQKVISKEGESIICLPNKVVVTVKKRHEIRYRFDIQVIPEHFYRKNEINENQKDCISWYAYGTGTGAKLC